MLVFALCAESVFAQVIQDRDPSHCRSPAEMKEIAAEIDRLAKAEKRDTDKLARLERVRETDNDHYQTLKQQLAPHASDDDKAKIEKASEVVKIDDLKIQDVRINLGFIKKELPFLRSLKPCPPPSPQVTPVPPTEFPFGPNGPYETASFEFSGYLGGELVKNWGWARSTERLASTDAVTNQFSDRADPVGGGFLIGYKFAPWANSVIVSPFASFDFLHAPVNHTFPGGSYLGTTANFMGTGGIKIGPQLDMGLWLYGIAGVSVLNETLNVNFIPVASSQSAWVAGGTLGVGGAWQPSFLQGFGRPVSLFLEYQHSWWQSANFNTPAASALSNYNFARQDDVVKFGFTVSLAAPPPPPPTRGLITK